MAEEEKGFVIKDRRAFDQKGDLKEETAEEKKPAEEKKAPSEQKEQKSEEAQQRTAPLPEVNFTSLIFSLSSSALFHMGEIADPVTGEKKKELGLAKHAIDTIAMLKEKTKGNLSDEEGKFLESILTDLKWRYVRVS